MPEKARAALNFRADLSLISNWISPGSRVLDLGCGNGILLEYLKKVQNNSVMGIEIRHRHIFECLKKGIPVIEENLNHPLNYFKDSSFDYVILSQTIQEVSEPDKLIQEMLRVGKHVIVSFPNFGHIRLRTDLFFSGKMPKSKKLPYEWFNTPNIHLMTLKDFKHFCKKKNIRIERLSYFIENRYYSRLFLPNLFSQGSVVMIKK